MAEGRKRTHSVHELLMSKNRTDITIAFRTSNRRINSFGMSMLSPKFEEIFFKQSGQSIYNTIDLKDFDERCFDALIYFTCRQVMPDVNDDASLLQLAKLANRLNMKAVKEALEKMLLNLLRVNNCITLFRGSERGLERLRHASYRLLQDRFQEISQTDLLFEVTLATMERLLQEDELGNGREEDVLEAALKWITRRGSQHVKLLRNIRFGAVRDLDLLERHFSEAELRADEELKQLIAESMVRKGKQEWEGKFDGETRLCEKWLVLRRLKGSLLGSEYLKVPKYVATSSHGRILVSDSERCQVVMFSGQGADRLQKRIGSKRKGKELFCGPAGVAVDREANIFVADSGNHRIQVFNSRGQRVGSIGSMGTAVGELRNPQGVAIDAEGLVVVADSDNHRIQAFHRDGTVAYHLGREGVAEGELSHPQGVAVDGAGRIVVADWGNHRVQVFNRDGTCALCFGSEGSEPGQFQGPEGVAVDREGRLVVCDNGNHRLQTFILVEDDSPGGGHRLKLLRFNPDGRGSLTEAQVVRVGGAGCQGAGGFDEPVGVALDSAGRFVVVEQGNRRVHVL